MTELEVCRFLAQFQEASSEIHTWPKWMQDAAHEAAASFPRAPGVDSVDGRKG